MKDLRQETGFYPEEGESVHREVAGFFKDHPFLLVSEERLAALLCRPLGMVLAAVEALEETGFLTRKDGETLLCTGDYMAEAKAD